MSSIFVKDSLGSLYGAEAAACSIFAYNFEDEITNTFIICPNDFYGRRFYQTLSLFFNSKETLLSSIPKIFYFPSWDTLPFEQRSPDSSITGERVSTLFKILNSSSSSILISPVNAVFQKVISKERFYKQILKLGLGQKIEASNIIESMEWLGYRRSVRVEDLGQYALRSSVLDLFSPLYENPIRIQLFNSEIVSIRFFECSTQRSIQSSENNTDSIFILPVREFGFTAGSSKEEVSTKVIPNFRELADNSLLTSSSRRLIEEDFLNANLFNGAEQISNYLFNESDSIFSYYKNLKSLFFIGDLEFDSHISSFYEQIESRHKISSEKGELLAPIDSVYLKKENTKDILASIRLIRKPTSFDKEEDYIETAPQLLKSKFPELDRKQIKQAKSNADVFWEITKNISEYVKDGFSVLVIFPSFEKLERVRGFFEERSLKGKLYNLSIYEFLNSSENYGLYYSVNELSDGFIYHSKKLAVFTERELFSRLYQGTKRKNTFKRSPFRRHITSLSQIELKDYVVHEQYGIGRFLGLKFFNFHGSAAEFLDIEYADGARLYVPVQDFLKVGKYSSSGTTQPSLTKLGSGNWERVKAKVKEQIAVLTGNLLKTIAARSISKGFSFSLVNDDDDWFAGLFPYEETSDQLAAINDVLKDMSLEKPMDRLICGDVGFGKTEVAIRASFKAAMCGKQVAILVPTTILAEQHFRTFSERFEATPIKVSVLNRFVSKIEQKNIISQIESGDSAIIIGTHRLLQNDVIFNDLGLIIIDEEHRFGVAHKERFKQLRTEVDILSMSATPIPRTLQMALFGTKDLSLIETPPIDRQAVHTEVLSYNEDMFIDLIKRELARDGQVFVVHHFIEGLREIAEVIKSKIPHARVDLAHGRIQKTKLEETMRNFYEHKVDVLVATSIIESGLDISNANTIIVLKSEQFGLAQLYQLRGRVGRSSTKGYAYLFHSPVNKLPPDAVRRLRAMENIDELGIGYQVALQDMEIRGAGSLLGKDQSGNVQLLGYETYIKVLEEAVQLEREKRGDIIQAKEKMLFPEFEPEVNMGLDAYIPESFIPDINERLLSYQICSSLCFQNEVDDFFDDILDRYGYIPHEVKSLVFIMRIRNYCKYNGIRKLIKKDENVKLSLIQSIKSNSDSIISREKVFESFKNFEKIRLGEYLFKVENDSIDLQDILIEFLQEIYVSTYNK